jgi:hypothetical protein
MRWLALALVARSATTTTCPGTTPTDDTPSPVAGCSFDADWCGWNNTSSEGTRWTLGTETTPTRFTGPNEGVNGTGYAYVEASHPNHPSVVFELTSPLFETPASTLSFAYSMYGAAMGSLSVDTYVDAWVCDVWYVDGNLGDSAWRSSGVIDVSSATRLRIRAVTGAGAAGDAAIDNVVVTAAPAPSMKPSLSLRPSPAPSRTPGSPTSSPISTPTPAPITPPTPAPSTKAVVASSSSSKDNKQTEEDALGDPDAASTSGLVYILGGCLLALSCGLLGAVRLKHCNKPKPPLHVELGLKKRSEAGPPPKVQRDEDAMRLRRQELGAMAWSSDEESDDEEAQKKDEENRTALFRRQPSSLESRFQKARPVEAEDAELERALARAEEAERRRDNQDAELERALAASKVTAAAEASNRARPASPEDMAMSSEDEELEVREHPEFSPQKLALYDDLDRSRRSASPILRVPSPAGGALLSEASIKRAQQSSRASSPRISEARKPSPLFGRSASPFSGDSWGPSAASDGDWPSPEPSPDARPPPPPWQGDNSPGSFEARRFSEKADDVAASDGSASSGWPDAT